MIRREYVDKEIVGSINFCTVKDNEISLEYKKNPVSTTANKRLKVFILINTDFSNELSSLLLKISKQSEIYVGANLQKNVRNNFFLLKIKKDKKEKKTMSPKLHLDSKLNFVASHLESEMQLELPCSSRDTTSPARNKR